MSLKPGVDSYGRWRWTPGRMNRWLPGIAASCRWGNTEVQGTGNREQGSGNRSIEFCGAIPHPYFGRKILVFLRLQTGLRCKIVKTKEFPAKSSRIRSYGPFLPLPAEWRRKEDVPGRLEGRLLRIIVHEVGK
jgi:hypothetical protein